MSITVDERYHPDLAEAVRRLVETFQPDRIYLFGSQARGDADVHSDYDILIIVPDIQESGFRGSQRAYSVLWGINLSLEVLVLRRSEFDRDLGTVSSIPATTIREGRLLYAS